MSGEFSMLLGSISVMLIYGLISAINMDDSAEPIVAENQKKERDKAPLTAPSDGESMAQKFMSY